MPAKTNMCPTRPVGQSRLESPLVQVLVNDFEKAESIDMTEAQSEMVPPAGFGCWGKTTWNVREVGEIAWEMI